MSNRLNQFIHQIRYRHMALDENFLSLYLTDEERTLFDGLKRAEQNHSILVAKALFHEESIRDHEKLVKAGLLHDIGKSIRPLLLLEKGLYVISQKILGSKLKRLALFDGVATYLYHGERGAEILRRHKVFEDSPIFYHVIKTHHWDEERIKEHKEGLNILRYHFILKQADDQY